MTRSKFIETQVIGILKQVKGGGTDGGGDMPGTRCRDTPSISATSSALS